MAHLHRCKKLIEILISLIERIVKLLDRDFLLIKLPKGVRSLGAGPFCTGVTHLKLFHGQGVKLSDIRSTPLWKILINNRITQSIKVFLSCIYVHEWFIFICHFLLILGRHFCSRNLKRHSFGIVFIIGIRVRIHRLREHIVSMNLTLL